jgi:uncharacterized cupredoxin-like copper-binding protein
VSTRARSVATTERPTDGAEIAPGELPPGVRRGRELRAAGRALKPTLIVVGALLVASIVAVVIALVVKSDTSSMTATVKEFKITMPTRLGTGVQTFALKNVGTVDHELVIFKTTLPADQLPLGSDGDVIEDSSLLHNVADSGEPLKAGGVETVKSSALSPGHYVAVCNLPGHYRHGMRLDIQVH